MKKVNKVISTIVSLCFIVNAVVYDISLGQSFDYRSSVDKLATPSVMSDIAGIQHKDMARIKFILEEQLLLLSRSNTPLTPDNLKTKINKKQFDENTIFSPAAIAVIKVEEIKAGLLVQIRIKDKNGPRTYYTVCSLEKKDNGFPLYIYTEEEYQNSGNLETYVPQRKLEDDLAIEAYKSHESLDRVIAYAHERGLAKEPILSRFNFSDIVQSIYAGLNIEVRNPAPGNLIPIEDRKLYLIPLTQEIKAILSQAGILGSNGMHPVAKIAYKDRLILVPCSMTSSNNTVHVFLNEKDYEMLTLDDIGMTATNKASIRSWFTRQISHEIGVMCGIGNSLNNDHLPFNDIDHRYTDASFTGKKPSEKLILTLANLDHVKGRDYAASGIYMDFTRLAKEVSRKLGKGWKPKDIVVNRPPALKGKYVASLIGDNGIIANYSFDLNDRGNVVNLRGINPDLNLLDDNLEGASKASIHRAKPGPGEGGIGIEAMRASSAERLARLVYDDLEIESVVREALSKPGAKAALADFEKELTALRARPKMTATAIISDELDARARELSAIAADVLAAHKTLDDFRVAISKTYIPKVLDNTIKMLKGRRDHSFRQAHLNYYRYLSPYMYSQALIDMAEERLKELQKAKAPAQSAAGKKDKGADEEKALEAIATNPDLQRLLITEDGFTLNKFEYIVAGIANLRFDNTDIRLVLSDLVKKGLLRRIGFHPINPIYNMTLTGSDEVERIVDEKADVICFDITVESLRNDGIRAVQHLGALVKKGLMKKDFAIYAISKAYYMQFQLAEIELEKSMSASTAEGQGASMGAMGQAAGAEKGERAAGVTQSTERAGLLFDPGYKVSIRDGVKHEEYKLNVRPNAEVRDLLLDAKKKGINLEVKALLRGVDGPGSSLDLPEFQIALTKAGARGVSQITSTPTISSDFSVTIRFEAADNPNAIEYVAPDYGIAADKPYIVEGKVELVDGKTPNGQKDGPAYIFANIFGITGVRIVCERVSAMALAGAMESSNAFNVALFAAASMLSGQNWTMADIFSKAVEVENKEFAGLTGGQGHLSSMLGGAYHHMWLSGIKGPDGKLINPYGAFSMPFLSEEDFPFIEGHMVFVQAGKKYENGKAVVGRTAALTNNMWTDLLRENDKEGVALHTEKLGLADRYIDAMRRKDLKTVAEVTNRYVDIRDRLCIRWAECVVNEGKRAWLERLEAGDRGTLAYYGLSDEVREKMDLLVTTIKKDIYWLAHPSETAIGSDELKRRLDKSNKEINENAMANLKTLLEKRISIYSDSSKELIAAARAKGCAIMPLGAGGLGATCVFIAPEGISQVKEICNPIGIMQITEEEASSIIRGTGELKGYMPFKVGREPIKFTGFDKLGLESPAMPVSAVYSEKTGKFHTNAASSSGMVDLSDIQISPDIRQMLENVATRYHINPIDENLRLLEAVRSGIIKDRLTAKARLTKILPSHSLFGLAAALYTELVSMRALAMDQEKTGKTSDLSPGSLAARFNAPYKFTPAPAPKMAGQDTVSLEASVKDILMASSYKKLERKEVEMLIRFFGASKLENVRPGFDGYSIDVAGKMIGGVEHDKAKNHFTVFIFPAGSDKPTLVIKEDTAGFLEILKSEPEPNAKLLFVRDMLKQKRPAFTVSDINSLISNVDIDKRERVKRGVDGYSFLVFGRMIGGIEHNKTKNYLRVFIFESGAGNPEFVISKPEEVAGMLSLLSARLKTQSERLTTVQTAAGESIIATSTGPKRAPVAGEGGLSMEQIQNLPVADLVDMALTDRGVEEEIRTKLNQSSWQEVRLGYGKTTARDKFAAFEAAFASKRQAAESILRTQLESAEKLIEQPETLIKSEASMKPAKYLVSVSEQEGAASKIANLNSVEDYVSGKISLRKAMADFITDIGAPYSEQIIAQFLLALKVGYEHNLSGGAVTQLYNAIEHEGLYDKYIASGKLAEVLFANDGIPVVIEGKAPIEAYLDAIKIEHTGSGFPKIASSNSVKEYIKGETGLVTAMQRLNKEMGGRLTKNQCSITLVMLKVGYAYSLSKKQMDKLAFYIMEKRLFEKIPDVFAPDMTEQVTTRTSVERGETMRALLRVAASKMVPANGGILAADESTGTAGKRLESVGLANTPENRQTMRQLILTVPGQENAGVSSVILYSETFDNVDQNGKNLVQEHLINRGILPGIKTDAGLIDDPDSPGEKLPNPKGLQKLPEILATYKAKGAVFSKWRITQSIDTAKGLPTEANIRKNAEVLAKYAKITQEAGLVPIVEPEVLLDGDHNIATSYKATTRTLEIVFEELVKAGVWLDGIVLKSSMVLSGNKAVKRADSEDVGYQTLKCMLKTVPAEVPAIVFLSGGQEDDEVNYNLDAVIRAGRNKFNSARDEVVSELAAEGKPNAAEKVRQLTQVPWQLSYSFGRGLQRPGLKAWAGKADNFKKAQDALIKAALTTQAARLGSLKEQDRMNGPMTEMEIAEFLFKNATLPLAVTGKTSIDEYFENLRNASANSQLVGFPLGSVLRSYIKGDINLITAIENIREVVEDNRGKAILIVALKVGYARDLRHPDQISRLIVNIVEKRLFERYMGSPVSNISSAALSAREQTPYKFNVWAKSKAGMASHILVHELRSSHLSVQKLAELVQAEQQDIQTAVNAIDHVFGREGTDEFRSALLKLMFAETEAVRTTHTPKTGHVTERGPVLKSIMRMVPVKWIDYFLNIEKFCQSVKNTGCEQIMVTADEKSTLIFSEKATFGEYIDGNYEEGMGIVLPSLAKSGVRVAVVATTDRQKALIEEFNAELPKERQIIYAGSIPEIMAQAKTARYYYYKVASEPDGGSNVTSITIVVKKILDAIGKVMGIVDAELIDRMHEAARQFAMAA